MTTLSEILKSGYGASMELEKQWLKHRGLDPDIFMTVEQMRYIERLEARLSEAEKVITDLSTGVACVFRFNGCTEEYITARLKQAHDVLAQREREEAR